jgi:hypothetical protein
MRKTISTTNHHCQRLFFLKKKDLTLGGECAVAFELGMSFRDNEPSAVLLMQGPVPRIAFRAFNVAKSELEYTVSRHHVSMHVETGGER